MTEWLTIFDPERNTLGKKLRDEIVTAIGTRHFIAGL